MEKGGDTGVGRWRKVATEGRKMENGGNTGVGR